jgi:hypothetical protein
LIEASAMNTPPGISGRIAAYFQSAQITPLLALLSLLLGAFAVMVTPREEEPQINVTMANVLVPFPGASVRDVEQMIAGPAEQKRWCACTTRSMPTPTGCRRAWVSASR